MEEAANEAPRLTRRRSFSGGSPLLRRVLSKQISGGERFGLFDTPKFADCTALYNACKYGLVDSAEHFKEKAGVHGWPGVLLKMNEEVLVNAARASENPLMLEWVQKEYAPMRAREAMLAAVEAHRPAAVDDGGAPAP